MARTRHHGRNDDAAPLPPDAGPPPELNEDGQAMPTADAPAIAGAGQPFPSPDARDAEATRVASGGLPRWLVTVPGCHPGDLVIEAATELEAVEAYKAKLGIQQLPVPAVVTPAPDDAPAPE